jgi:hypothetical protein
LTTPIDAIPDLSDNQVSVFTDWMGRSPQEVEDQITYPLTVSLQGLPSVRVVRSSSASGFSMINVIFEDSVDFYFAPTTGLERLNLLAKSLPLLDAIAEQRRYSEVEMGYTESLKAAHDAMVEIERAVATLERYVGGGHMDGNDERIAESSLVRRGRGSSGRIFMSGLPAVGFMTVGATGAALVLRLRSYAPPGPVTAAPTLTSSTPGGGRALVVQLAAVQTG